MTTLARPLFLAAALLGACAAPGIESSPDEAPLQGQSQATHADDTERLAAGLERARTWLIESQAPDGTWSSDQDGYTDAGLTALATLALVRSQDDSAATRRAVSRGVAALLESQDLDSGRIGPDTGHAYHYGHAIGTLVLCELHRSSGDPELELPAAAAVRYVLTARNPYGAWRYDYPPTGDNDTSITGWMLEALSVARSGGFEVDRQAFQGGLNWIDEVTDQETGRVGYDSRGSYSSRIPRVNDHLAPEMGEAMTAVGLASRAMLGQDSEREPAMLAHAELIQRKQPEWDPAGVDLYYWYHGTRAMRSMGGRWWSSWRRSVTSVLLDAQRSEGKQAGSWDPVDVWSHSGGRAYTTAVALLTLAACDH